LATDDILEGNAADSIVEMILERLGLVVREDAIVVSVQVLAFDEEHLGEQEFGRESGVGNVMQFQALGGRAERFADGHATSSFLRRSVWKWVFSASRISVRSPSMIVSNRWSVRLMRWSLTRFSR